MIQLHKTNKRIDGSDFENDFLETEHYYKFGFLIKELNRLNVLLID